MIKKQYSTYIFENPMPQLRAVNSAFPWLCELEDGRILAAHQMGQAFESVDGTTYLSESIDGGKTWSKPWKAYNKSEEQIPMTDCGKPVLLGDGRIIMLGYKFFRPNPELPLGNPKTGGLLEDQVYFAMSEDAGKTWSEHKEIQCIWGGHVEASAPLTVLDDGSWATPITGFRTWEGEQTSRNCGRLLRSYDQGETWNDDVVCMQFPGDGITCYEQRMCQMKNGALVVIGWNEEMQTGKLLNNHVTVSFDNGITFGAPIDTGIHGQASSILHLGDNRVLTLHAVRRDTDEPGIYACIADLSDGDWKNIITEKIWEPVSPVVKNSRVAEIFAFLKFGQPGAILLRDGDILMSHWVCEDGCYKTVCTRMSV